MASARYLLNIQPEGPEEPPHRMTRKEKAENFWFYYKWHVLGAIFAIVILSSFVYEIATKVDPDYQIAIVTQKTLPDDVLTGLETQFATFADDYNGDGRVSVSVMLYTMAADGGDTTAPADPYTQMAGATKLMADAQSADSMLYLTDDVEGFQTVHSLFAYNDGTFPAEGQTPDYTRMGVKWTDCPQLAQLDLGEAVLFDGTAIDAQKFMKDFVLLKRVFDPTVSKKMEKLIPYYDASTHLFDTLTAGA